jgi:hypothetical protein
MLAEYASVIPMEQFGLSSASFSPFVVRAHRSEQAMYRATCALKRQLRLNKQEVDVSFIERSANVFCGECTRRKFLSMTVSEFMESFDAYSEKLGDENTNRSLSTENVRPKLYLSQVPLYVQRYASSKCGDWTTLGNSLLGDEIFLQNIESSDECSKSVFDMLVHDSKVCVTQVNLWINIDNNVSSSIHYDNDHNLLVLYSGCKTVLLFPPSKVCALPAYSISANHAAYPHIVGSDHLSSNLLPENVDSAIKIVMQPGDILFIPEGWW